MSIPNRSSSVHMRSLLDKIRPMSMDFASTQVKLGQNSVQIWPTPGQLLPMPIELAPKLADNSPRCAKSYTRFRQTLADVGRIRAKTLARFGRARSNQCSHRAKFGPNSTLEVGWVNSPCLRKIEKSCRCTRSGARFLWGGEPGPCPATPPPASGLAPAVSRTVSRPLVPGVVSDAAGGRT